MRAMADYEFPPDLVDLRVEQLDADAAWSAAGDAEAAVAAYGRVQDLTMALHRHEWLQEAGNTHSIRAALLDTAKGVRAARGG